MDENFPNLRQEMHIQIHEAQRIQNRMNQIKTILRHIIIKLSNIKDKERTLTEQEKSNLSHIREPP